MIESRKPALAEGPPVALITAALAICLLLFFMIRNSPAPSIEREYGDTTIRISADRAWSLYPGDCVNLQWRLEGIESVHIDGAGVIGWGERRYCPDINARSPLFEVRARNGVYREFQLDIQHLPDLLFYLTGFVIFAGAPLLAVYYLSTRALERPLPLVWMLIGGLLLAALGGGLRLRPHEAPLIDARDGETAVRIWAEHDRILFPHECVRVSWSVLGAQSISFNGRDVSVQDNPAIDRHCAEDGAGPRFEIVNDRGESRTYRLAIPALFPQRTAPPPFFYISLFGIVLGCLIYAPLLWRYARANWRREARADALAIGGCFFALLVFYLPFGFDSSGHWEEWIIHGYLEGGTLSFYVTEAVSRPFVMIPHTLAYLISSESFFGHHLVNFLQYAGRMALLYVILRQLGVAPSYAFLTAILFMVYPVNDALMTLRRLPKNFSVLTLLLSTALFIDYCKNPRRLTLLGIWLGLLFSVNSNETGYAMILVVPPLLWLRDRKFSRRRLNLSVIWYIVPAIKLASLILLLANARDFYQSGMLSAAPDSQAPAASVFDTMLEALSIVFPQTFIHGWQEALATLGANQWWLPSFVILAAVGCIAWVLTRHDLDKPAPTLSQLGLSLLAGLALVLAAVGVLMWLPLYRNDPWRMYLLVPIGAAISAFSLLLLLASPLRDRRRRDFMLVVACLLIFTPAIARLFNQHHGFVESAHAKAQVLHQVLTIAPRLEANTQLVIVTDMDGSELSARGVFELLNNDMLNSALYVLYQDGGPEVAYFCHPTQCGEFSGDETIFDPAAPADLLARTLVFALKADLSIELIDDPAKHLGLDLDIAYEADALYDPGAALPARAGAMLARSRASALAEGG
ncbi:MAG: hypothetical protein OXG85_10940 [Chloroflexi bacterium]|nr:hypothetical protein [Chloroflexota bacterium]